MSELYEDDIDKFNNYVDACNGELDNIIIITNDLLQKIKIDTEKEDSLALYIANSIMNIKLEVENIQKKNNDDKKKIYNEAKRLSTLSDR